VGVVIVGAFRRQFRRVALHPGAKPLSALKRATVTIIIIISFRCSISTYHISGSSSAGTHTHYLYITSFKFLLREENQRTRRKTLVA